MVAAVVGVRQPRRARVGLEAEGFVDVNGRGRERRATTEGSAQMTIPRLLQ
jgi:hypothetical protein